MHLSVFLGHLVVDHRRGSFQRAGQVLDLTPTEAALLRYLLEHRGRTVTRGELLKAIWDIGFDTGTNLVDVHISRLRAKLDEPFDGPLVLTVRGVGYTLADGSGTEGEAGGS